MVKISLSEPFIFDWDRGNQLKNWVKHRVTVKEAEDIFYDSKCLLLEDIKHSSKEESRYILIGHTKQKRMLFIIFTIREDSLRVISARDTNRKEEDLYEKAISAT